MRVFVARAGIAAALAAAMAVSILRQAEIAPAMAAGVAVLDSVRVGVWTLWRDRKVELAPAGTRSSFVVRTCQQCAELRFTHTGEIEADGDSVTFSAAGNRGRADRLWINNGATLAAHGERLTLFYPVTISARKGVLAIVATLPVERYVERVVASESGSQDSAESLKALAIVVRTFALHETHGHADYDLCDSTHCQLLHWAGNSERAAAAHAATLATAGETLWYTGKRALGYFNKDCGGRTASVAEIWPKGARVPYLISRPDRFCAAGGSREWASEIARADLSSALAARGLAPPGWKELSVGHRGESGRVVTLRVDGKEIPGEDFRVAVGESLGWNRIPSTWFEVSRRSDTFIFHGRGWGHGVGLCQKGAAAMAEQGNNAAQIVEAYFPGAVAADEETGLAWRSFRGTGFVLESLDAADAALLPEIARARAEASDRSGLNAERPFVVRTFGGTVEFRAATQAPGWVAAFTEGEWIGTQPLRTLAARHLLVDTLRHEFLHALVEREAGPAAPLWLREGLAETWSDGANQGGAERHTGLKPNQVDAALTHASSEAESEAAHRAAGQYAAQLLARYGRTVVMTWLHSGVPASVAAGLGG